MFYSSSLFNEIGCASQKETKEYLPNLFAPDERILINGKLTDIKNWKYPLCMRAVLVPGNIHDILHVVFLHANIG